MSTLSVHMQDDNQLNAIQAFLEALKIPFEKIDGDNAHYNLEFVAKIEKSIQEAKDSKAVTMGLDDIWSREAKK